MCVCGYPQSEMPVPFWLKWLEPNWLFVPTLPALWYRRPKWPAILKGSSVYVAYRFGFYGLVLGRWLDAELREVMPSCSGGELEAQANSA